MRRESRSGRSGSRAVCVALFAAMSLGGVACPWSPSLGEPLKASEPFYETSPDFRGKKDEPAEDLSGIACKDASAGRLCLMIDDQVRFAQAARVGSGTIVPLGGQPIRFIRDNQPVVPVIGPAPGKGGCPGKTESYEDLDGEGVAYDGTWFYVVGSHGCSRKDGDFALSSFLLARLRLDDQGRAEGLALTHRLAGVLGGQAELKDHFTQRLQASDQSANGLNVEGIAAEGGKLFVGLRAPSLGGDALIAVVEDAEALFKDGALPPARIARIAVGDGAGIRDLTLLRDGRLLLLSGPAQEQDKVPYKLWAVARRDDGGLDSRPEQHLLGCLAEVRKADGEAAKAEAVAVTGGINGALRVLVLFDGLKNGGGREYTVPLRGTPC